jgi:hypothetical protein
MDTSENAIEFNLYRTSNFGGWGAGREYEILFPFALLREPFYVGTHAIEVSR